MFFDEPSKVNLWQLKTRSNGQQVPVVDRVKEIELSYA